MIALPFAAHFGAGAGAGAGGKLELIELQTAGASVSEFVFSGLDGDSDSFYWILGQLDGGGGVQVQAQLNGDTGNNYGWLPVGGAGASGAAYARIGQAGGWSQIMALIAARRLGTSSRIMRGWTYRPDANSGQGQINDMAGHWTNNANNLTSLRIFFDGSTVGAGSELALYKVNR